MASNWLWLAVVLVLIVVIVALAVWLYLKYRSCDCTNSNCSSCPQNCMGCPTDCSNCTSTGTVSPAFYVYGWPYTVTAPTFNNSAGVLTLVDSSGASSLTGTTVKLLPNSKLSTQQWNIVPVTGGGFYLRNLGSKLYISVSTTAQNNNNVPYYATTVTPNIAQAVGVSQQVPLSTSTPPGTVSVTQLTPLLTPSVNVTGYDITSLNVFGGTAGVTANSLVVYPAEPQSGTPGPSQGFPTGSNQLFLFIESTAQGL